jgi:hypothetical protein
MVNGVNPATFFILPMLGKHGDEYPRFRDCFVEPRAFEVVDGMPVMKPTGDRLDQDVICVFTRVGGGNREDYQAEIDELRLMPGYIEDFDDMFDPTFATFVYKVPEKWLPDYRIYKAADVPKKFSPEYQAEMKRVYPKLAKQFDELFK